MKRLLPDVVCATALFILNAIIIAPLFTLEYSSFMGSIEAAYISISRQWMTHGIDFGWWPLWYMGIPGQNTYPPLLHILVAVFGSLAGVSAALSHHAVTAAFYCFAAITVYWLVRGFTGQWKRALLTGVIFSVVSPSVLLIPNIQGDTGAIFCPRRTHTLIVFGDGPHVVSITLIPLALVLLHYAVTRRKGYLILAAALGIASVALTNWLGTFALVAAIFCYLLARPWKDWMFAAGIGLMGYAIASPWIPPSTILAVRSNAQIVGGDFRISASNLVWLAGIIAATVSVSWSLKKFSDPIRFAASFTLLMGSITLLAELANVNILPQPHRYHLEMELGICLLAGLLFPLHRAAVGTLILFCCYCTYCDLKYAHRLVRSIDITTTSEYKVAQWIDQNMNRRRVMVPGSTSFWLNAFTDTPELSGGFDQGIINHQFHAIHFQILSGMNAGDREGEIAKDWLRALGIHAVAVSGPVSTEIYKPFANWKKFEGVLKPIWRDGDDIVYEVPQRSASLARALQPEYLVKAPPAYATMTEVLQPYLNAIDDLTMPETKWTWVDRSHARVEGNLSKDLVLSIQMNYHPGWTASSSGRRCGIRPDGLGLMVIEPECSGSCVVDLEYDGGAEMKIAKLASILALILGVVLAWRKI